MKKLLLLTALLIFACSSDDSSDDNDNNSNDPIVGTWENFYIESYDYDIWSGDYENSPEDYALIFNSDGSYDLFDNVLGLGLDENYGTWSNIGNNIYEITERDNIGEVDLDKITFICSNNIMIIDLFSGNYELEYYQKEGYNYQNCNEIEYNAN